MPLQRPKGTQDHLPDGSPKLSRDVQASAFRHVQEVARRALERAGAQFIGTPLFEEAELVQRGVGGSTDIVRKEMFTVYYFGDHGGYVLRPEATAGVVRAYLEGGLKQLPAPLKLWTHGPMFRAERQQKGRLRQFHQVDYEVLGSPDPLVDAEAVALMWAVAVQLGLQRGRIKLGSIGDPADREAYNGYLRALFTPHLERLSDDSKDRLTRNPMRILDSKSAQDQDLIGELGVRPMLDFLGEDARTHFGAVQASLRAWEVPFDIDPSIVRGLDYYRRTAWELHHEGVGAKSALGGGGRYDGLAAQLGGPEVPAVGWALGIERLLLALEDEGVAFPEVQGPLLFLAAMDEQNVGLAAQIGLQARKAGRVEFAYRALKPGSVFKEADRRRARLAAVIGSEEAARGVLNIKDLKTGESREVAVSELHTFFGGAGVKRSCYIGELGEAHVGRTVTLQGWATRRRDLGGLIFIELRDRSGTVQVEVEPDSPAFAGADAVRSEYVLEVEGRFRLRPEAQRKGGLGDYEVMASRVAVLNAAKTPPFELDKGDAVAEDIRLKYRYLDLRRAEMQRNLILRSKAVAAVTRFLDGEGFLQVETPMLTKSTPEGARDFLVPSRLNPGEFYALPQSPQLFKQLLMISGIDRYYQLARCFRDEDLRADRQPDFTQLDMEMSFVTQEDVLELQERLLSAVFRDVLGVELALPFPRLSYREAMDRYGSDKPDLRFGSSFVDVTDLFRAGAFQAFAEAGAVKVLAAPELTRRQIDELERVAKQNGARGLAWLRRAGDGFTGGISKFVQEQAAALIGRTGVQEGGTLLFAAGEWKRAVTALGAVRLALRDLFDLAAGGPPFHVSWVLDFPQLEFDEASGAWTYMHHPFTAPHPDDVSLFGTPGQGEMRAQAYDLVLNGFEVGGGSIRIHDPEVQEKMFAAIGFTPEQAAEKFGFFLDALAYGTPPHGGIAWGFDRLVMVMAGAASIREVIAFPKNNRGADLMAQAPSPVEDAQLAEVGVAVRDSGAV